MMARTNTSEPAWKEMTGRTEAFKIRAEGLYMGKLLPEMG